MPTYFRIEGDETTVERFRAWAAMRNGRHKKTVVLGDPPRKYIVSSDEPYAFIGMTSYGGQTTYQASPDDLVPALLTEMKAVFPSLTFVEEVIVETKKRGTRIAQPAEEEPTYRYLNHCEFVWSGHEWHVVRVAEHEKQWGLHWIVQLLFNPAWGFTSRLCPVLGQFPAWTTLDDAEKMIFKAARYPMISIHPNPMFLRKSVDRWIEINACRIWNHIYDTKRKTEPIREAEKQANYLRREFEALFLEPTKKPQAAAKPEPAPPPIVEPPTPPIVKTQLHPGLKRDLKRDRDLRDMLDRFESDAGNLSDTALRQLLQFWGIQVRATEIVGDRIAYFYATSQYRRLLELAGERGWTQSIINMYGVMTEGVFERIC